jgi:hypothetical protein
VRRGAGDHDHEIPDFVPGIGVAVGLDDLVERERTANDRSKLAALDERPEKFEVGLHRNSGAGHEDRPPDHVCPEASRERRADREHTAGEAD